MKRKHFIVALMAMLFSFSFTTSAQQLLVNCDYNSSTEGWGTTKFSNYAGAYAYATANSKTSATIVIEKTNIISGNTFDNNHKNYSRLAVVIKDGATMGNAASKWDMTYPVTVEPGGTLTCARPASSTVSNIHIKNKLIVGAKGATKKAYVNFLSDEYQDCDISIRYNGSIEVYNADFAVQDLDAQGKLTIEDSKVEVDGAFVSATSSFYPTTLTNSTITINGNQISGGLSDFSGGDSNQLGNVKMNNSTLTIKEGDTKVAAAKYLGAPMTVTGSTIEVNNLTITDGATLNLNEGSALNAENITTAGTGSVKIDGVQAEISGGQAFIPVAQIGEQKYATLTEALEATKTMTGDVTVEIYDKVTFNQPLIGNYTSIKFVGKEADAEMYLDVQGYTTATGKKVSFTDLKLSKSEGGFITNAGFMNVAFGIYDVEEVTYTNCTFENGACASSGKVTFNGCTFKKSWDKYGLWAYGNVDVTVQGSTFANYRGIKMYAENGADASVEKANLTVKNTNFSAVDNKPAIVLTYGESVVLEGNTYSSTGTFELDLDGKPNGVAVTSDVAPVCVNDNGACGVLVDGKIYTTVAQAAEVATETSTVTLLHSSDETVEFPMGTTIEKNGFTADNVTTAQPFAEYVVLPISMTVNNYKALFGTNTVTDGTNYYATLQAAVEAIAKNAGVTRQANAILYCKPGADVGSLQHAPVVSTLTIYGNDANVTGGSERDFDLGNTDPSGGRDITADMTLTVKHLNGCGAWGAKATDHTVNLVFENCANMGKVFISGTTGTLNITMNDCAFEGVLKEAVYSNADGAITLNNVAFSNLNKAINLNHKAAGTQTVTINGCSFTNCGADVAADQIPVRVLSSVDGGKSVLNVSNTTFAGTPEGGADILLDYGVGETTASVTATAANVFVEKENNVATKTTVTESEGGEFTNVPPVAKVNGIEYMTLAEAVAAAQNGETIILIADVKLTAQVVIPEGKELTLDLNGKTVTHQDEATKYAINNLGTLTIQDTKGNGSINARGIYNGYGDGGANVATAKITVLSGTINAKGTNGGAAVYNYGIAEIKGGTFTSIGGYSLNSQSGASMTIADGVTANNGIYVSGATLVVDGGEISGNRSGCHVLYAWNSTVTINGGEFYNNNSGNSTTMAAGTTELTINGGTFGIKDGRVPGNGNTWTSCLTDAANTAQIIVNGGTLNGGFRVQSGATMTINGGSFNDVTGSNYNIYGTVTVTGGTFTDETAKAFATKYVSDDCTLGEEGKVVSVVAKIGEIKYETLDAAVAAAKVGDKITLLNDADLAFAHNPQYNNVYASEIDLNGKTMTIKKGDVRFDNVTIKNGNIIVQPGTYNGTAIFLMYSKNLTFDGVKVTATGVASTYLIGLEGTSNLNLLNGSEIVINNESLVNIGSIIADNGNGNTVTIKDSKIDIKNSNARLYLGGTNGNITVENSDIDLNGVKEGFYLRAGQTLAITGTSTVDITLNTNEGRYGINLTDISATYTKAETATVNATLKEVTPVAVIGTQKFASLQAAIDAAILMTGDVTIEIMSGTYAQDINLTNAAVTAGNADARPNITFKPAAGADVTFAGTTTLGYRVQNVGASMWQGEVIFDGIKFNHAENGKHSLDIQDVKGITLLNCTVTGDGEYGIGSNGSNATPKAAFTNCTFENGAMQVLGQLSANLVIDGCTFDEFSVNAQGGAKPGLTIKNSTFNLTLTDAHVGESFYAVRSNANPINIQNTKVTVDSELSSVAADQAKWGLFWARKDGKDVQWNVASCEVNLTDAAMAQTELPLTKNDGTANAFQRIILTDLTSTSNNVADLIKRTEGCATVNGINYKDGERDFTGLVAKIGDEYYATISDAVAVVEDGGTITLIANETFTKNNRYNNGGWWDGLGYSGDKSFTIDLADFTISQDGALNDYLMWFKNDGAKANTITLKNGTLDAGTTAYSALATASSNAQKITVNLENINVINNNSNGAALKIRGGSELNVKAGTIITGQNSYLGIETVGKTTVVNIYEGAEIYQNGTSSYCGCLAGVSGNGTINVYGGKGQSKSGGFIAMTSGGTINIEGGEWIANTDGTYANGNKSVLVAQSDKQYNAGAGNSIVNVTGGTFKGGYNCYGNKAGDAQINIKGGNFNSNPASYVAEDYIAVENNGVWNVVKAAAKIGEKAYATLEEAFKAATSGCTIEILSDVTVDYKWDARYTGAKFTVPVTINGNGKTIKFTASVNDNNYQAPFRFEADATVKNLTIDMSEVTDNRFRAISSKGNLIVYGCKFIGKDETLNCRAIIFGEGAGANVGNLAISITNSEFINWKRGITDNENAQDVKTVTITGNKLTDAGVGVSAKETVTFTDNTVAGAYVNIKSYTAGNKLAVTATGNTLEANTDAAYNVINAGGAVKADEGFNVVAKGGSIIGYTGTDRIWGEVWGNARESFVIKVLDANGNVMGTSSLNNIDGIIDGDVNVTWSILFNAPAPNPAAYWSMEWTTAPTLNNMPAKVELWVDGTRVSGGPVVLNGPDDINKINVIVTDAEGKVTSCQTTVANALAAAKDGEIVNLLWKEGQAPLAMNGSVFGKNVTIKGTAKVDWSKGFLFVGRGGEGNATVTFDGANLTSASNSSSTGIHVSGREKNTTNKYDGTLVIKNSTIELDYLINRNAIELDNATLTVKNGFGIAGRPASETESAANAIATISLANNSKVVVNNHNGMGLGQAASVLEGLGVMNIDKTSAFETTQGFVVTANGTMNIAGNATVAGTLTNNGAIVLTDAAATLTSSECGNVTTSVQNSVVSYIDGKYTVGAAAAKFGDKYFATLAEAIAASTPETGWGGEVTLLKDVTLEGGYADAGEGLRIEKSVTINGAGYTIDCGTFTKGIRIYQNGDLASNVMFKHTNIVNNNAQGRCIDTRSGKINLMLNGGVNLTAHGTNSQPLTIGGSEAMTKVTISGGTIDAGTSGYAVICFVPVTNHINVQGNAVIKGLAAFYLKEGVTNTAIKLAQSTSIGTNVNSAASGDFGAIVIEGSNNAVCLENNRAVVKAVAADGAEMAAQAAFLFRGNNNTVGYYPNANPQVITEGGQSYFVMAKENATGTKFVKNGEEMVPEALTRGYQFITVEDALRYTKNGEIVKLLANAELDETYVNEKSLTLDLNGKTLSTAYVAGSTTNHLYAIHNNGELTITDSSDAKTGKISARGNYNYAKLTLEAGTIDACDGNGGYAVKNFSGSEFIMNGGAVTASYEDGDAPTEGYDATTLRIESGATAIINGGEINNSANYTFAIDNAGEVTVNGGTVKSIHTTVSNSGTLTINDGSFTCNGLEGITAHVIWATDGSTTTINGGTFDGKDNYNGFNVDASKGANVVIKGGNFLSVHSGSLYGDGTITVSGGTFLDKIAETYLAMGYQLTGDTAPYKVEYTGRREAMTFVDGEFTEYVNDKDIEVGKLTYIRKNMPTTWTPIYLPFEVPVKVLADQGFEVAYINGVRRDDTNYDGELDDFVMEVIYIHCQRTIGGNKINIDGTAKTLKANYPYFVRSNDNNRKDLKIELDDVTLYAAQDKSYECTTMTEKFEITGNSSSVFIKSSEEALVYGVSGGTWSEQTLGATLKPFRFYMTLTSRDGSEVFVPEAVSQIRILVRGEENFDTTDIESVGSNLNNVDRYYDLQGRRVLNPVKGSVYIVNGKKVIF